MAPRPKRPEGPIPVPSALPTRIAVSLVLTATVLHRLVAVSILVLSGVAQGSFDASGQQLVLLASRIQPGASRLQDLAGTIRPFLTPFVRWDTLHFLGAAAPRPIPTPASTMPAWWEGGYAYEHSLAFQPGLSFLLRWTGYVGTSRSPEDWNVEQSILLTTTLAIMAGALAPVLLLLTTKNIWGRPNFAILVALLSIWSPSPATLISPTPEPFFAFFTLAGLWLLSYLHSSSLAHSLEKSPLRWAFVLWFSALLFALATLFRANGILSAGFLLWYSIWWPVIQLKRRRWSQGFLRSYPPIVLSGLLGAAVCIAPFILFQVWAYGRFCVPDARGLWCGRPLNEVNWLKWLPELTSKSVYSYVQRVYWEVGLFRYWTLAQIPNFVLAAPVLYLAVYRSIHLYCSNIEGGSSARSTFTSALSAPISCLSTRSALPPPPPSERTLRSLTSVAALPYLILLCATGWLLLLDAHVQIAIRFASPVMVGLWWTLALVLIQGLGSPEVTAYQRCEAQFFIGYLVLWNVISLVLYAGFYPPA